MKNIDEINDILGAELSAKHSLSVLENELAIKKAQYAALLMELPIEPINDDNYDSDGDPICWTGKYWCQKCDKQDCDNRGSYHQAAINFICE